MPAGSVQDRTAYWFARSLRATVNDAGSCERLAAEAELYRKIPGFKPIPFEKIFRDIIDQYGKGYLIMIKQHPRDLLDYKTLFSDCILLDKTFPTE